MDRELSLTDGGASGSAVLVDLDPARRPLLDACLEEPPVAILDRLGFDNGYELVGRLEESNRILALAATSPSGMGSAGRFAIFYDLDLMQSQLWVGFVGADIDFEFVSASVELALSRWPVNYLRELAIVGSSWLETHPAGRTEVRLGAYLGRAAVDESETPAANSGRSFRSVVAEDAVIVSVASAAVEPRDAATCDSAAIGGFG